MICKPHHETYEMKEKLHAASRARGRAGAGRGAAAGARWRLPPPRSAGARFSGPYKFISFSFKFESDSAYS
ncbi:hypothetical protein EVAR_18799_1 [Eumeta japonica]|uniref:Uncharacterized protein n=1 Tax=Eumeta variegata TaxID=151549 RepID=A0A4C1UMV8_EUMVA|nr:hypothetical protein EVAR_18799_1 [Eumeta japonica]